MLLISREYPPFVGGGIGTYTVRMAKALAAQGHQPVVVTVGDCDEPTVEEDASVRVARLPFLDYVENQQDWAGPRRSILDSPMGPACHAAFWAFHRESVLAMQLREYLPWLLETFDPPAIEAPDTGALLWFILNERRLGRGPLAGRADAPPILVHLHSPTAWIEELQGGQQPGRGMAELRSMERDVLRWADGVASPSRMLAEWTRAWEPTIGSVEVTPYPLGEPVDLDAPLPTGGDALFVGRMERRKGFDTLAQALGRLGSDAPLLRVAGRDTFDWVAGEMFGAMAIQRHCEGRDLRMLGELPPSELAAQRRACGIAVVASPNDNYPNTCMEAMVAGQIVVAANAGGMAEMIEDGVSGLLFEPGSVEDLSRQLGEAASMAAADRSTMQYAARQRVLDLCGDQHVVPARLTHARSLRAMQPTAKSNREVAIVAFDPVGDDLRASLTDALRANTDVDVVAPWFSRMGPDGVEVVPFSTPSAEQNTLLIEHPGPLAVDAAWWRRLEDEGVQGGSAAILLALVERGARAAVLPEVVAPPALPARSDVPGYAISRKLTDAERAANQQQAHLVKVEHRAEQAEVDRDSACAELAEIRSSRAYRLASAVSRLLHRSGSSHRRIDP